MAQDRILQKCVVFLFHRSLPSLSGWLQVLETILTFSGLVLLQRFFWCPLHRSCPNLASLLCTWTLTYPSSSSNWFCSLLFDQFCNSLLAFVFLTQNYWGSLYCSQCRGQLRIKSGAGGGRQETCVPIPTASYLPCSSKCLPFACHCCHQFLTRHPSWPKSGPLFSPFNATHLE